MAIVQLKINKILTLHTTGMENVKICVSHVSNILSRLYLVFFDK